MENKRVVNLTPHDVIVVRENEKIIFPRTGIIARVGESVERVGTLLTAQGEIPLLKKTFTGEVENLPPKEEGTIYIVSLLVAQASPYRDDLFIPQDAVRDPEGRIVGVRGLERNPYFIER